MSQEHTPQPGRSPGQSGQIIDLFSGVGGFSLAGCWNSFRTVCFCEINPKTHPVLKEKFPGVPIHLDIKTLTREKIIEYGWNPNQLTVLTGGFPCQPASVAGKRAGTSDNRWLWPQMLRIIAECRPDWVIAENVPGLLSISELPHQTRVVGDDITESLESAAIENICESLEKIGYQVQTFVIPAGGVGALHRRERVWTNAVRNGFDTATVTGIHDEDGQWREERTRKGVEAGGDIPALPPEQLHPDSDTNSERCSESSLPDLAARSGFDPRPYATPWNLCWNPDRSQILRAGYGVSDELDGGD